jgi:AcrR family transcriptional regulator
VKQAIMRTKHPTEFRQAQIAEAALRLIGLRGISSLTMATLAAEVGVTVGALYKHFPSRDPILVAVAALVVRLVEGTMPPADRPPVARLTALADGRVALMASRPELATILFSEQVLLALPAEAVAKLQDIVMRPGRVIAAALTEARAAGDVRDDVPLPELVALTMGTIRHLTFLTASPLGGKMAGVTPVAGVWQTYLTLIRPGGAHAQEP